MARLRQEDLAQALGVTRGRIAQLEGGWPWTAAQVVQAASLLGCSPAELLDPSAPTADEAKIIKALRAGDSVGAFALLAAAFQRTKE